MIITPGAILVLLLCFWVGYVISRANAERKAPNDGPTRLGWSHPALHEVSYTPFNPKQDRYYRELLSGKR